MKTRTTGTKPRAAGTKARKTGAKSATTVAKTRKVREKFPEAMVKLPFTGLRPLAKMKARTAGAKNRIVCIGAGTMGTALMMAAAEADKTRAIAFTDANEAKGKAAAYLVGGEFCASNAGAAATGAFVFLAVKPEVMPSVLEEIAPVLKQRAAAGNPAMVVSMAAGWTIAKIQAALQGGSVPAAPAAMASIPVARIMPNTPVLVSRGVIALSASPRFPPDRLDALEKILSGAGFVDRIHEKYMDAVTALSGSGPAFASQFIEALADGGVLAGLPRETALRYAAHTLRGAAALSLKTGRHPGELKDMVASPGGTTIQGIAALERAGFRGAVISAVEAAWKRAGELG